jgi:hypothetical protein
MTMRSLTAAALAASLMIFPALAQAADTAPLAPGKPAGVKQAQIETGGVLLVVGILVAAGAIAAIASTTQGDGKSSSSTTTTG